MGRELKRVALDFQWPLNKTWHGYLNPYRSQECVFCEGSGYAPKAREIADNFYASQYSHGSLNWRLMRWADRITQDEVDALVAANRLQHFDSSTRRWVSVPRTAAEVNNANSPGAGRLGDLSHDGINRSILIRTRVERMGFQVLCPNCNGDGDLFLPGIKELHEKWEQVEPPSGPGFQLWETTSEGSPVSPVFDTIDALCDWCETNASTFASLKASKAEWLKMLEEDNVYVETNIGIFI